MYRKLINSVNEKGYTLLESLFQLLIFSIFAQLFVMFFFWKGMMEEQYFNSSTTEWELFSLEFQELLMDIHQLSVSSGKNSVRITKGDEVHVVEQYHSLIRRTKKEGGHVPMLTGIRNVSFQRNEHFIMATVTMQSGKIFEKDFIIHDQIE